jgi:hypothetical protein
MKSIVSLVFVFLISSSSFAQQQDFSEDIKLLDAVLLTLYEVISREAGEGRN